MPTGEQGGRRALTELRVRNYAVIRDVSLTLGPGLNVLTGETGAGKSILVGALSLLLGERASSDAVRAGEERAVVEASFDVEGRAAVTEEGARAGHEPEEGWLVVRREVQREGRNRVWVNGSPATVGTVGRLGSALVELHGQHQHQALLRPEAQRRILDAYAGAGSDATEVERHFQEWRAAEREAVELREQAEELRDQEDYLRHEVREIEDADLQPGEAERLEAEARRLSHSEELLSVAAELYRELYAGEHSLVERLGAMSRSVRELTRVDPEGAESLVELYEDGRTSLQELGRRLGGYRDDVEHDPARLRQVRERLDRIYRLQRRYGGTTESVLAAGRDARRQLTRLHGLEEEIGRVEGEVREHGDRWEERAGDLSRARREAAGRLEEEITSLLPELGMPDGRFEVAFRELDRPSAHGAEDVEFRVTLNAGFDPAPLSRVASGGELSRVMLALKTVLADVDEIPCLVFDEIDAGVGGEVAHRVAARLARVARRHQVFVITHLPQIAARADVHYRVEKGRRDGRAATRVRRLKGEERTEEIARMMGGDPESRVSLEHARELLGSRPDRAVTSSE